MPLSLLLFTFTNTYPTLCIIIFSCNELERKRGKIRNNVIERDSHTTK